MRRRGVEGVRRWKPSGIAPRATRRAGFHIADTRVVDVWSPGEESVVGGWSGFLGGGERQYVLGPVHGETSGQMP